MLFHSHKCEDDVLLKRKEMWSIKLHKRSFDEFQYLLRSLQGRWSFVQYSVNAFAMLFLRVSWFHLNKENEIKMKIC